MERKITLRNIFFFNFPSIIKEDKSHQIWFSKTGSAKGQLISKCPFGVIVSTKIPTKKFDNFCPSTVKAVTTGQGKITQNR